MPVIVPMRNKSRNAHPQIVPIMILMMSSRILITCALVQRARSDALIGCRDGFGPLLIFLGEEVVAVLVIC